MVMISSEATSTQWQRAKAKAQFEVGVGPRHVGGQRFEVPSATSTAVYMVEVQNPMLLQAICTCSHGAHTDGDPHCWHVAPYFCLEVKRVSRRRMPAPQPLPQPCPTPRRTADVDERMQSLCIVTAA